MDNGESPRHFANGDALRQAAENRFGRSLSSKEWVAVDPDGWSGHPSVAYSEADLEDLLQEMAQLPEPADRPTLSPQRAQALAHRQRTAVEAKEFVGKDRIWLFGSPAPPFENAAAAAAWIEARAAEPTTLLFTLTVALPAELKDIAPFLWLRDWLVSSLPNRLPDDDDDRKAAFRFLLQDRRSPIRHIGSEAPLLEYLAPVESRRFEVKHIRADDGTILGNLHEAANRLAKATGWNQLAACHHLLTGGVMSSPVRARSHNRWGRESFGGPTITIEVPDPFGVSADEVARAYVEARENILRPAGGPRRRSRASARRERVAALVEEAPDMTWAERWTLWNQRYPDQRFPNSEAMRRVYRSARRQ